MQSEIRAAIDMMTILIKMAINIMENASFKAYKSWNTPQDLPHNCSL